MVSRLLLARVLALAALLAAVTVVALGSVYKPGFSQFSSYISELAAEGSLHADAFAVYGFLPMALLLAAFLVVAAPLVRLDGASRIGFWLLLSQALSYMTAGFVPCDPGCPMQGSLMQQVHNLLGLVTSLATGAGIFLMASASTISTLARTGLILGGIIWSLTFVLMPEPALVEWRGFLQRIAETVLWLVVLYIAFALTSETVEEDAERASRSPLEQR